MRSGFGICALLLVLAVGSPGYAQDAGAEPTPARIRAAAEAFDRGREAYKAAEYVLAAEQFEKADSNAASSAALELAVRARDAAGELDRAATLMALALKRYPGDENLLKLAPNLSARAAEQLYEISTSCDTPCYLTVGGKVVHGAPDTQRTIFVQPGSLALRAGWSNNRNDSKQIEAEKGGKGQVNFVTPPDAPAEGVAKEPTAPSSTDDYLVSDTARDKGPVEKSGGWSPAVFFVGTGLTVVAGGITVWSGIDTVNNPGADAVKAQCQDESCALYQEGLSKQRRTNVLIGVTAAVGVATILVGAFATDWSGGKNAQAEAAKRLRPGVDVAPWASHDGGGFQAVGRF